jgi:hypothetical protein
MLAILDISNLNIDVLFSLECLSNGSFWSVYAAKLASIFILFSVMYVTGFLLTWKKRESGAHSTSLEKSISAFLMLMTTLYIYVLSATFSAFRCIPQDDGSYTLLSSPDLD